MTITGGTNPYGQPPYARGAHPPYVLPMPYPPRPPKQPYVVTPRRKLVLTITMALAALALVYALFTPLVYPEGQPRSGGIFLWQWTPHLLAGQSEFSTGLFVTYFLLTFTSALGAVLAVGGVLGTLLTQLWRIVLGAELLLSLLMTLTMIAAFTDPDIAAGEAVLLAFVGGMAALVVSMVRGWREAFIR